MKRRLVHLVVFAVAIAGLNPAPSAAAPAGRDWLPEIPDSASLDSAPIAAGRITTAEGDTFPGGAAVELVAYPAEEVIAGMAVGDSIQLVPVAKAYTQSDGGFVLRGKAGSDYRRFESNVGIVNLAVRAYTSDGQYSEYSFSAAVRRLEELSNGHGNAGQALVRPDMRATPADPRLGDFDAAGAAKMNKTDVCGETLVQDLGARPVAVGASYTGASNRTAKFTYTSGATSTLGVGFSVSGKYGSYAKTGTMSMTSTATVGFAERTGGAPFQGDHVLHRGVALGRDRGQPVGADGVLDADAIGLHQQGLSLALALRDEGLRRWDARIGASQMREMR